MIICECGEIIDKNTFRDYIRTSKNPSTSTIGHEKCGLIYNFIDQGIPRKYSTRKVLKNKAMKFAEKNRIDTIASEKFLVEVDRLKTSGNLSDMDILITAFQKTQIKNNQD